MRGCERSFFSLRFIRPGSWFLTVVQRWCSVCVTVFWCSTRHSDTVALPKTKTKRGKYDHWFPANPKLSHCFSLLRILRHIMTLNYNPQGYNTKDPYHTSSCSAVCLQGMATLKGRSWRISSRSWRLRGEEQHQAWWASAFFFTVNILEPDILFNIRNKPLTLHTKPVYSSLKIIQWRSPWHVLIVLCLKCKCLYLIWIQDPSHTAFKEKMKEFMASFDKNSDGRIEMLEVRTDLMIPSH